MVRQPEPFPPAPTTPARPVIEVLHGETVIDPYRWLETVDGDTLAWVDRQNDYTEDVLGSQPQVAYMQKALASILGSAERYMAPYSAPGRIFIKRQTSGRSQPVLVLLTPDKPSGTIVYDPGVEAYQPSALDWYSPSPSGHYVALGISRDGSEDASLSILEVETGTILADRIPHARGVSWLSDETGFVYTSRPHRGDVPDGEEYYHAHLKQHTLGESCLSDLDLFGAGRPMRSGHFGRPSKDGCFLYIFSGDGWRRTEVYRMDLATPARPVTPLLTGYDATFSGIEHHGRLLVKTNHHAPHYRIVAVDPEHPEEIAWQDIVPESDLVVRDFAVTRDAMAVHFLRDVSSVLIVIDLGTGLRRAVDLPNNGTLSDLSEGPDGDFLFMFESFTSAPTLYRLDPLTGALTQIAASTTSSLVGELHVRQDFYLSQDGTRCPMYLVYRGELGPGPHPTVLTGYGGFNVNLQSHYIPEVLPFVAAGGVFVQANMRGGGEYGEGWHRAGMEARRQNSWDDFEAAARHLITQGVTDSPHLGVTGRSLGGLLTAVLMTQHPDLVAAVVSGVPLLDMLRYHLFLIGALWIVEYGDPANAKDYAWLRAYSPYHHVTNGVRYPATYLIGAMNDGRVDACHARKMAARLQDATRGMDGAGPVLLRSHFSAGHGPGTPVEVFIQDHAEAWGFLAWRLGLEISTPPSDPAHASAGPKDTE